MSYIIEVKANNSMNNLSVHVYQSGYCFEVLLIADYGNGYTVGSSATVNCSTLYESRIRAKAYNRAFEVLDMLLKGDIGEGYNEVIQ